MSVHAQTHAWIRTNPGGGGAFSTVGASASGIILAGSDLSGAYRSLDQGASWDVIGASKGMNETHVSGLGFHRTDGDILFIGTENGIFKSSNGGESASRVLVGGYITDIEFGTNADNVGYASWHPQFNSNNGQVFRSSNTGSSWTQVSTNLPGGLRILKLLVNPLDANIVYLLSGEGRFACGPAEVYRSTDGGMQWTHLTPSLKEVLDVALDPNNPSHLLLTTMNADCNAQFYWTDLDGDLHESTDGGITWSTLYNQSGVIWIDRQNSDHIRLIDPREPYPWIQTSGTWLSTNGGQSFTQTGHVEDWDTYFNRSIFYSYGKSFNGISKTLGEDLSNPSRYYWITSQWIYGTSDYGMHFENLFTDQIDSDTWQSRGFDNVNMTDISISPVDPDLIYTGYFDIGLWRSTDKGASWQSCNDSLYTGGWRGHGGNTTSVLADPHREHVVWATMSGNQNGESPTYLLKNSNGGDREDWTPAYTGLPLEEIMGISIDRNSPVNNRTLLVTALGDVYRSIDDGASWSMVFDCNGCRFTAIDHFDGQRMYVGGETGVWLSVNAGQSWLDISNPDMRATTGRHFWDRNYDGVFDVQADPHLAGRVYVTALGEDKGLYRRDLQSTVWTKVITDDHMRKVTIAPQHPQILYATSSSAFEAGGYSSESTGVWFSDDGGLSWSQQNDDMAYPFALAAAVTNESAPTAFIGSPGTGFQYSAIPLATSSHIIGKIDCIELHPNPFTDQVVISGELGHYAIAVLDVHGQTVRNIAGSDGSQVIDLQSLPDGMYFLTFRNLHSAALQIETMIKQ